MSNNDPKVQNVLFYIDSSLQDSIALGEALCEELSKQSEQLDQTKAKTDEIVADAKSALHLVRAMHSTPYAMWKWCIDTWFWISHFIWTNILPKPSIDITAHKKAAQSISHLPNTDAPSIHYSNDQTNMMSQVQRLKEISDAIGNRLDHQLQSLDHLNQSIDRGQQQLNVSTIE